MIFAMAIADSHLQSPIFFIMFVVVFFDRSSFARADETALIAAVCSKTPQPVYCHQCVNSFPIIKKDTVRDLAAVAIDCAIYQASVVHGVLYRYSQAARLPEIARCVSVYDGVQEALRQAATSWRDYQYGQAGWLLGSAMSGHWDCYNLLVKAKWNTPIDLANAFYTFTAYDDVAKSVLTQIK